MYGSFQNVPCCVSQKLAACPISEVYTDAMAMTIKFDFKAAELNCTLYFGMSAMTC